jgi:hypothetical protein
MTTKELTERRELAHRTTNGVDVTLEAAGRSQLVSPALPRVGAGGRTRGSEPVSRFASGTRIRHGLTREPETEMSAITNTEQSGSSGSGRSVLPLWISG